MIKVIKGFFDYMILGSKKDRRISALEIENRLAKDLIERLQHDMRAIHDAIEKEQGVSKVIGDPYWRLNYDIGRCEGYLNHFERT